MNTVSRIAKNSIVMMIAEVTNKIIALVLIVIIARYLGDVGFGQYSFIITLMMLFHVLANFGLDELTIREVAKNKDKTEFYIGSALSLKLILSLITFVLLSLAVNLMGKTTLVIYSIYLAGLAIIFSSLANTFDAIFNAYEKLELKALILILTKLVVLSLTVFAIFLRKSLITLVGVLLIGEIVRLIFSCLIYMKKIDTFRPKVDAALRKNLFLAAIPFVVIGVMALIYFKIDIVMLSVMKTDQVVGWYSAAFGLLATLMFIANSYNLAIFPVISRYTVLEKKLFAFSWEKSVKYLLIFSLPIAIGTTILADRFILLFYSTGFEPSIIALRILIWTLPWIFVNSINMRVLYASNYQKKAAIVVGISMIINIVLNLLLIPKYSYIGASLATIFSEIINVSIFFWLVFKLLSLKIKFYEILPKPLIASLIMGIFIYFTRFFNLAILIFGSGILYLTLLFILKVFDEQDRLILRQVASSIFQR